MDSVSLIEAALVAGAAASSKETTSQAVKDAYTGLKALLSRLFTDKPKAQIILDEHENDPKTYEKPLKKLLADVHIDQNPELVDAAKRITRLIQPQQIGTGQYTIQNTGPVQGQIIGGSNHQIT